MLDKVEEYYHTLPAIYGTQVLSGQNFVFNTRVPTLRRCSRRSNRGMSGRASRIMRSRLSAARSESLPRFPARWCWPSMHRRSAGLGDRRFSLQLQDPSGDFKSSAPSRRNSSPRATRSRHRIGQHEFRVRHSARAGENQSGTGQSALGCRFRSLRHTPSLFRESVRQRFVKFGRVSRPNRSRTPVPRARPTDISKIYVRATNGQGFDDSARYGCHDHLFQRARIPSPILTGSTPRSCSGPRRRDTVPARRSMPGTGGQRGAPPQGFDIDWSGISYQERKAGNTIGGRVRVRAADGVSVLAAQYESWSVPSRSFWPYRSVCSAR